MTNPQPQSSPPLPPTQPERGYIGPAVVRFDMLPDSKWNGKVVSVFDWHPSGCSCRVRVSRRKVWMSPRSLALPTPTTGEEQKR